MWQNRETFNGLSVLPYFDHSYKQAPFTDCTKEEYEELLKSLSTIDLTKVIELSDDTDLRGELACFGASCEIT
jgi:ribonucleoside-triphosphate reductase